MLYGEGDFKHLLPEQHNREACQLHDDFINELKAIARKVEKLNEKRTNKTNAFNPDFFECSVSI